MMLDFVGEMNYSQLKIKNSLDLVISLFNAHPNLDYLGVIYRERKLN